MTETFRLGRRIAGATSSKRHQEFSREIDDKIAQISAPLHFPQHEAFFRFVVKNDDRNV